MKKNAIVSLANSDYFELLNELIDSIKSFDESKNVAICVLDAGLNQDQKNIFWTNKIFLILLAWGTHMGGYLFSKS